MRAHTLSSLNSATDAASLPPYSRSYVALMTDVKRLAYCVGRTGRTPAKRIRDGAAAAEQDSEPALVYVGIRHARVRRHMSRSMRSRP